MAGVRHTQERKGVIMRYVVLSTMMLLLGNISTIAEGAPHRLCVKLDKDTSGLLEIVESWYIQEGKQWKALISVRNISEASIGFAMCDLTISDSRDPAAHPTGRLYRLYTCLGVNECLEDTFDNSNCMLWLKGDVKIVEFTLSAPQPECGHPNYSIRMGAPYICYNNEFVWHRWGHTPEKKDIKCQ
jgi:hypothetical protein